jgi:hypothetical protein
LQQQKSEFAKEKDKVEGRALFVRLKREKEEEDEVANYIDWVFTAEQSILSSHLTTENEKRLIMESRRNYEMKLMRANNKDHDGESGNELDDVDKAFAPPKSKYNNNNNILIK